MRTGPLAKTRLCVLLPAELHAWLTGYAPRAGISPSEAARRALDAGLPALEDQAASIERQRKALEAMRRFREETAERYGVYQGDLVNGARAERDRQNDRVRGLVQDEEETGNVPVAPGPDTT